MFHFLFKRAGRLAIAVICLLAVAAFEPAIAGAGQSHTSHDSSSCGRDHPDCAVPTTPCTEETTSTTTGMITIVAPPTTEAPTTTVASSTTEAPTTTEATPTTTQASVTTTSPLDTTPSSSPPASTEVTAPTSPVTATKVNVPPSTSPHVLGKVVQSATPTSEAIPVAASLPRTGLDAKLPLAFGLSCLLAGALLVLRRRGAWSNNA